MTRNMGTTDRMLRAALVAPALVIVAVLVGPATPGGAIALVAAAVMLGTAAVGFCPLYRVFGLSTDRRAGSH